MTSTQKTSEVLKTSDATLQWIDVDGYRLSYTDEGPPDAPPIIMVHGVPGSVSDFRYLAPHVSTEARVLRIDLPGFGGSVETPWRDPSLRERARLLAGFADALGLARFAVLGHSMGGATVLMTAAHYPDRVSHLILVASVGLRVHRALNFHPRFIRMAVLMSYVPGIHGALLRSTRKSYKRLKFPRSESLSMLELRSHMRMVGRLDFDAMRRAAALVRCPTLVAHAHDDHLVEVSIWEELLAHIPGASPESYPTGGHNIQKTRANELGARIRAFMREP